MKRVNCYACVYFKVTWNPRFPKACTFYGFKTRKMPSQLVFESTGEPCQQFRQKDTSKP